jgi:RNA polymerase sigma factor (sigma-70 family)
MEHHGRTMNGGLSELLHRCREGEEEAVALLVRRFEPWGRNLAAAYLSDEDLARDAVQEAFVTALHRLPDLRSPEAFPAWYRQIVRTHAIRILRRRGPSAEENEGETVPDPETPRSRFQHTELLGMVERAFGNLPAAGRETAQLFYFEERSCAEIATTLRIPEGTVKRRLHDVRRRLRSILLGYIGNEPPPSGERAGDEREWRL